MVHKDQALAGQFAIVTGATSGIGRGVAIAMAAAGATVGINYRSGRERADRVVEEIAAQGGKAAPFSADVSDEAAVDAMFGEFRTQFGVVDILVANAGIQRDAPFAEMSFDVIDVSLTGQFLCARAAVRAFRARKAPAPGRAIGKIIFMSSVHELIP